MVSTLYGKLRKNSFRRSGMIYAKAILTLIVILFEFCVLLGQKFPDNHSASKLYCSDYTVCEKTLAVPVHA